MLAKIHPQRSPLYCKLARTQSKSFAHPLVRASQRSAAAPARMELHSDIAEILFSEQDIKMRVAEMGKQLALEYQAKKPLVLGVLPCAFFWRRPTLGTRQDKSKVL